MNKVMGIKSYLGTYQVTSVRYKVILSHKVILRYTVILRYEVMGIKSYLGTYKVECNNCMGGFHENLVTFKHPKLPDFLRAQKMRLNCNTLQHMQ